MKIILASNGNITLEAKAEIADKMDISQLSISSYETRHNDIEILEKEVL